MQRLLFGLVFGVVFVVGGIAHIGWSAKLLFESFATRTWPTVSGTIIASHVQVNRGRGINYTPKVEYRYQVAGNTYTGSRIWNVEYGDTEAEAQSVVLDFPVDRSTSVHYKPDSPASSVLRTGPTSFLFIWVAVAWAVFSVGSLVIYFTWFHRARGDA